MVKYARIIFRAEGARTPGADDPMPVMLGISLGYSPATSQDCAPLADRIREYLTELCQLGEVENVWFSVPEKLDWAHTGQEIVVDGGVQVGGKSLRFRVEIHYAFCNCGSCGQEDAHLDQSVWI